MSNLGIIYLLVVTWTDINAKKIYFDKCMIIKGNK